MSPTVGSFNLRVEPRPGDGGDGAINTYKPRRLPSSLLPSPQRQTHREEEVVVVTLAPRLEAHVARGDVRGALVVLEFVRGRPYP